MYLHNSTNIINAENGLKQSFNDAGGPIIGVGIFLLLLFCVHYREEQFKWTCIKLTILIFLIIIVLFALTILIIAKTL